jgi:hypothetical protein
MMELLTENDARTRILEMLDSRDWWVIPWLTEAAGDLSLAIEKRYYAGEANDDFQAIIGPIMVSAGRKARMSPEQLGELMAEECPGMGKSAAEWTELCQTQDILVALREEGDVDGIGAMLLWDSWLRAAQP